MDAPGKGMEIRTQFSFQSVLIFLKFIRIEEKSVLIIVEIKGGKIASEALTPYMTPVYDALVKMGLENATMR